MNGFYRFLTELQEFTFFNIDIFRGSLSFIKYRDDTLREMYLIGTKAFWVVVFGGLFVGIILATETGHSLEKFGATTIIGRTVLLGMIRELGPVITGLLLAARTGAKNTSELGSMSISEQIDALRAFGTDPIQRLVVPRTVAALVMFLPLTLIADVSGIIGGFFITTTVFHIDLSFSFNSALKYLFLKDLLVGFIKPLFIAYSIASISCYFGLKTKLGTVELGKNTINAVVLSSIAVLVIDLIFTKVVWEVM
ncbi:MAG: ABC transporter permease [Ignavibacteriae bacterium]|nr:MAG: ABC transporter permease [Ignavibacteriota bacterium]